MSVGNRSLLSNLWDATVVAGSEILIYSMAFRMTTGCSWAKQKNLVGLKLCGSAVKASVVSSGTVLRRLVSPIDQLNWIAVTLSPLDQKASCGIVAQACRWFRLSTRNRSVEFAW